MKQIIAKSQTEAVNTILGLLGHSCNGSLAAQLDRRMISVDMDEDRLATVYTHSTLVDTEVTVDWCDARSTISTFQLFMVQCLKCKKPIPHREGTCPHCGKVEFK